MARVTTQRNREQGGVAVEEVGRQSPDQAGIKGDAIAQAMMELGKRASTKDLIGYAQQKFGVAVSPSYVSLLRKNLKKRGRGKRPQLETMSGEQNGKQVRGRASATKLDPAKLVMEVKELAQRAGGLAALKRLVDALVD